MVGHEFRAFLFNFAKTMEMPLQLTVQLLSGDGRNHRFVIVNTSGLQCVT